MVLSQQLYCLAFLSQLELAQLTFQSTLLPHLSTPVPKKKINTHKINNTKKSDWRCLIWIDWDFWKNIFLTEYWINLLKNYAYTLLYTGYLNVYISCIYIMGKVFILKEITIAYVDVIHILIWSQVICLLLNMSDHIKIYLQHH